MRALGPGSVSSFLKVILDVVRWVLMVSAAVVSAAIIAVLLLSFSPDLLAGGVVVGDIRVGGPWMGPIAAAGLVAADLYLAGAIVIVGRLRKIFQTLIAGDPFHPDNIRRLRIIGGALAALEVGRNVFAGLVTLVAHALGVSHADRFTASGLHVGGGVHLTTWFAVLVIVVLAEVFREGARLRGEAELTI
jgi:hypothetical protein